MFNVWVINGPNINMLGTRQPHIYGELTLDCLVAALHNKAQDLKLTVECRQSNHEGQLIDWLQQAADQAQAIIINAGGLTHTSVSLHDTLENLTIPKVEVHISNIYAREEFRHKSLISPVVNAVIAGCGQKGYILALEYIHTLIQAQK